LASIHFTPNPTYPEKAFLQLGNSAGEVAHQAANEDSDGDGDQANNVASDEISILSSFCS
jgi:hypothetical protein